MKIYMLLILLITRNLQAQTWQGIVNLTVGGDLSCRSEAESYLRRELHSLGDVTVSESSPEWIFDAVVSPTVLSGRNVGYNLSVVISTPFCPNMANFFQLTNALAIQICTNYSMIEFHGVRGGPDLRKVCSDAVTAFDTAQLEPSRKSFERVRQMMKSKSPASKPPSDFNENHDNPAMGKSRNQN